MQTVVESICKFIKLTMRCIKHLFGPFVEPYFKIIVQNYEVPSVFYQRKPVSTYLYAVETALTLFYPSPDYHQWLNSIFNHMTEKTYEHLQNLEVSSIDPDLRRHVLLSRRLLRFDHSVPQVPARSCSVLSFSGRLL